MPRDYGAEYERRNELAADRGFDSYGDQRAWIESVRDQMGEIGFNDALEIAQFERDYDVGDMTRDELADWWSEHVGDIDYDDPDDPFWDFLDALSGEGAA